MMCSREEIISFTREEKLSSRSLSPQTQISLHLSSNAVALKSKNLDFLPYRSAHFYVSFNFDCVFCLLIVKS